MAENNKPHIVIIGGGFGGLKAAKSLKQTSAKVTLVDRTNHHLFQPLLYQVAMAGLSPAEIASPLRSILRRQKNTTVVLDEVLNIDVKNRSITMSNGTLTYDYLIVSTGVQNSYFGNNHWAKYAIGLKDLDDAIEIRRRVLVAFEEAEREQTPEREKQLLTFVVIGGGPTGVELAGTLSELARYVLKRDFRSINPKSTRVILVERGERILTSFPKTLSIKATEQLRHLGVEVLTEVGVTDITAEGVELGDKFIPAATVLWGAGVQSNAITKTLGVDLDRSGRVIVEKDLTIAGYPEVYVIGDAACYTHQTGQPLPGVAPVAMQQGVMAAQNILNTIEGKPREKFHYVDKGSMATIGRSAAVAYAESLEFSGFLAWVMWLTVHIIFLIGFHNRAIVFFQWVWSYFTYKRGARLITGHRLHAGAPEKDFEPTTESTKLTNK
ncbi:MAG: NAD(P)/FAD-dependent oxidoreductase [Acidobacteria bacterium]|nr:NAD(P)/FAD-dependent oxidoreductase [Acidobacteriota bacterium]